MPAIYVPKCFAREREGKYGNFISISFDAKELIDFVNANTNAKGYFNVTVSKRRETSEKGLTHSVALDTFEPKERGQGATAAAPRTARPAPAAEGDPDVPPQEGENLDVPF